MKFETFKAGTWHRRYQYKSFEPVLVDHDWTWEDATINTLLEAANRALGELNAFSLIVPDIDLFIEMHVVKEAQTSSRIEGTQTNIEEALVDKSDLDPEKRDDWQEVHNYIQAINFAIQQLSHLPVLVDPSHGTGRRDKVTPMARAAVAAGADGLLIEVHCDPDHARSDGAQSLNPQQFAGTTPDLAFNTAVSFASNTNWQSYGGETTLSYLSQMLALTAQNFVSAATGIAVLAALIRGLVRRTATTIGNFWVDLVRSTLYILLPLSTIWAVALFALLGEYVQLYRAQARLLAFERARRDRLYEVARALAATRDVERIAAQIVEATCDLLGAAAAALYRYEPRDGRYVLQAAEHLGRGTLARQR